jgi:hypothetical protein
MNRKFIIGVDRSRMKLFDIEQAAQNLIQPEQEEKYVEHKITKEETPEQKYEKFSDFTYE